jgi:hypothetical protein
MWIRKAKYATQLVFPDITIPEKFNIRGYSMWEEGHTMECDLEKYGVTINDIADLVEKVELESETIDTVRGTGGTVFHGILLQGAYGEYKIHADPIFETEAEKEEFYQNWDTYLQRFAVALESLVGWHIYVD